MTVSASAKLRCKKCQFVRRNRRLYVICEIKKHKARQG